MSTRLRALAVLLLAGVGMLAFTPLAAAHVTVTADDAASGHAVRAVFRVPNERDDASTVRLQITFPEEHPLGNVTIAQTPGWTATVEKQSITWQGGAIKPGEFAEFPVSLSLPHGVDRLVFKAVQSYSDGQVVRWIEEPADGAPEPEHPAPVLALSAGHGASTVDMFARAAGIAGVVTAFGALAAVVLLGRRRVTRPPAVPAHRTAREKARV
ncbi:MAG TPA: YcnI family protein [Actinophytocola sp.]|uniref:YcnI family copper-binding membrane protein n=1 Tax=Actinophytocola sp. TaxID=1872138 RepID=UPI002DFDD110|nr:YcnI family protein [Actinophytocola sp.]